MDYNEFLRIMNPAIKQFGVNEFGETRLELIYSRVEDLGSKWLIIKINQMCISNNRFFDFEEAARNEFNNRSKVESADNVLHALKMLSGKLTDEGYIKAMRLFGATNFVDAVKNCREFKMYNFTIPELEAISPVLCEKMGI